MAAVHELLYNAKKIDTIHLQEYVSHLVKLLIETINISCNISTKINLKNIHLSLDQASTVGLVLNELITNSIKHGFANRDQGLIEISGTISDENTVKILFSDNGIGIQHVKKRKNSLGLELATNLIEQIDGQLIPLASQEGTKFNIIFPHS
jgi:two-component sensor histidine kinase